MVTAATLTRMRKAAGIPARTKPDGLLGATKALKRDGKRWFDSARASEEYVLWDRRRR
jgi:hypothetical protein